MLWKSIFLLSLIFINKLLLLKLTTTIMIKKIILQKTIISQIMYLKNNKSFDNIYAKNYNN